MIKPDTDIPQSLIGWLEKIPTDRPVALLLRHAERDEIPLGDIGRDIPITRKGVRSSLELGVLLKGNLRTLRTSPLLRCVQTAEWIRTGAEVDLDIYHDRLLGDPGVFVEDPELAWNNWKTMGNEGVMRHMATADHALPGMAHPEQATLQLIRHMLEVADGVVGIHVFVTHDVLLSATASRILGVDSAEPSPNFLEGGYFWYKRSEIVAAYRGCKI